MEQFEKLGLSKDVLSVLQEAGFKTPSEIQEKTIPLALAGKDIIGGSATGSGKTLAFASPIVETLKSNGNIQSLILTPTRELAEQVAKSIRQFSRNKRLNTLAVYGGVDIEPQMRRIRTADVVVGTPGRILDHMKRRTINLSNIKILVLDEVDRMFDMGFSRDVEMILHQCPKNRQTMMFSATISPDVDYLARKHTTNAVKVSAESYVDASKLKQVYYDAPQGQKFSLLAHLLKGESQELVMVFCNTRRNVDFVFENLNKTGIRAEAIHGGLTQNNRTRILDEFKKKNIRVLVCTDVAGRGLDIKGVSHIYNYNLPIVSTDYIHRIGRTARAGEDGKVVNLLSNEDYMSFQKIMEDDSIKEAMKEEPIPVFNFINARPEFKSRFSRGNNSRRDSPRRSNSRDDAPRRFPSRRSFTARRSGNSSGRTFNRVRR
jgi:ATP-dependent RNA helicase DeaD